MSIFDEDPLPKTFPMAKAPEPPKAAASAQNASESPENAPSTTQAQTYPRVDTKAAFCKPCENPPGSPPGDAPAMA